MVEQQEPASHRKDSRSRGPKMRRNVEDWDAAAGNGITHLKLRKRTFPAASMLVYVVNSKFAEAWKTTSRLA